MSDLVSFKGLPLSFHFGDYDGFYGNPSKNDNNSESQRITYKLNSFYFQTTSMYVTVVVFDAICWF